MDTKYCKGCKQELPVSAFAICTKSPDHLQHYCRKCSRVAVKKAHLKREVKDRDQLSAAMRRAMLLPPDEEIRARALGRGYYE